jgi:hypothetical protein
LKIPANWRGRLLEESANAAADWTAWPTLGAWLATGAAGAGTVAGAGAVTGATKAEPAGVVAIDGRYPGALPTLM